MFCIEVNLFKISLKFLEYKLLLFVFEELYFYGMLVREIFCRVKDLYLILYLF